MSNFHVTCCIMFLKFPKIYIFLQFCADVTNKSKYVEAVYIYASEVLHWAFLEIDIVYFTMIYCHISIWSWISIFWYLISMNCGSEHYKPYHFLKEYITNFQMNIYLHIKCFGSLRFLWDICLKMKKMHYFCQFKDHNSGRKYGNLTNDPNFSSSFWALSVYHILCNCKFSFIWSILVCKIPEFWTKDTNFRHTIIFFLKNE